jgi:hypothetical protein
MKRIILIIPVIILLSGSLSQQEPIPLFNGRNLEGWYTYIQERGRNIDPKGVFTVKDGMIRISGEEWGCITTLKQYENYHLLIEFKWGERTFNPRAENARDSGILLHSQGEDGATSGSWMYSIECQVIEGGTGDFIVVGDGSPRFAVTCNVATEKQHGSYVFQPTGDSVTIVEGRINWYGRDPNWQDVKGFRGINDIEKPAGEWNILECVADGEKITVFLNGIQVNNAIRVQPSRGKIQIQSEGAEIFFRRVDLLPLSNNTAFIGRNK